MVNVYEVNNVAAPIDFECGRDPVKRTLQNVKNLLMCHMGEVPYDRNRGFNRALLGLPINVFNARLMKEVGTLMEYEPDCRVLSAKGELNGLGDTIITVRVEIEV